MARLLTTVVLLAGALVGLAGCAAYVEPAPVVYRPYYYDPYYGGGYYSSSVVVVGGGYRGGYYGGGRRWR